VDAILSAVLRDRSPRTITAGSACREGSCERESRAQPDWDRAL